MRDTPRESTVGDFRLERLLAHGGMALLYEARQISLDRRVALKLIAPEDAAERSERERVLREARTAMELEHPNVVPVYGAGEADGRVFIAMRLIEGEDLQQIIDAAGALPAGRVLDIVTQIAGGLDAAHASGVVHRDVKPSNVMVQQLGRAREHCYLVDFGLAVERDASSVTGTGAWMGTPAYVSPEQLRGERVDARTDVYALGVLAFHALAGRPPYAREHDSGTLLAHLHAPPPSLCEIREDLPRAVDAVIARALAKTPQARFGSAGELASALSDALAGETRETDRRDEGLRTRPGNLPAQVSSFVGRRAELEDAREALAASRLLSVVGPGGVGKTALALHLAASVEHEYAGAWVFELDSVQDAAGLEPALARTLGLRVGPRESTRAALIDFISERPLLFLFDNCEHLLAEVRRLAAELLASCARLTIVATSREPLAVGGERVFQLGPLALPGEDDEPADVLGCDSARLLLRRAGEQGVALDAGTDTAPSIARICARLEGIPLAIELAAARLRTLSIDDLARRLQDDLRVLARDGGDRPERQRTLDDLIEWSWRRLDADERTVLARLAFFPGTFTLDAAEAIAGAGGARDTGALVLTLADKSLLQVDANRAEARFRMLQPVREFCLPHLHASAEHAAVRRAHRDYYLALAERAQQSLASSSPSEWLARLDEDQPNIRAAIGSGLQDGDADSALRIGIAMREYWACRGLAGEGVELLTGTLDEAGTVAAPAVRAKAHSTVAHLAAGLLGDARRAEPHAVEALKMARASGEAGIAAEALTCLSWNETFAGRAGEGLALAEEPLPGTSAGLDATVRGRLLDAQGLAYEELGDVAAAERAYGQASEVFGEAGYALGVALVENHLGNLRLGAGDLPGAAAHFSLARTTAEAAGDGGSVAMAALNLALVEHLAGRRESARELFVDSLLTSRARGDRANIAFSVFGLALSEPDPAHAAGLHANAGRRLEDLDMVLSALEAGLRDAELERLRAELGPEPYERACARGRELSLEAIVSASVGDGATVEV